jgi:hypothetical protein
MKMVNMQISIQMTDTLSSRNSLCAFEMEHNSLAVFYPPKCGCVVLSASRWCARVFGALMSTHFVVPATRISRRPPTK